MMHVLLCSWFIHPSINKGISIQYECFVSYIFEQRYFSVCKLFPHGIAISVFTVTGLSMTFEIYMMFEIYMLVSQSAMQTDSYLTLCLLSQPIVWVVGWFCIYLSQNFLSI